MSLGVSLEVSKAHVRCLPSLSLCLCVSLSLCLCLCLSLSHSLSFSLSFDMQHTDQMWIRCELSTTWVMQLYIPACHCAPHHYVHGLTFWNFKQELKEMLPLIGSLLIVFHHRNWTAAKTSTQCTDFFMHSTAETNVHNLLHSTLYLQIHLIFLFLKKIEVSLLL